MLCESRITAKHVRKNRGIQNPTRKMPSRSCRLYTSDPKIYIYIIDQETGI